MATEREIKKRIKDLQVSITAAKKAASDPSNPNREYAQRQLDKFNKEIKDLQNTTPEKDPSEKAAEEAQIRLTGKEKGTKPIPPGTFTPVERPAFTPAAKPTTVTPAAKTASTVTKPTTKKKAEAKPDKAEDKKLTIDEILALVAKEYGPVDATFREDPQLSKLLRDATANTKDTSDDYTRDRFLSELQATDWWAKNSEPIRKRQFSKRQYEDLLKKGGNAEELAKTTEYGRGLATAKQFIADSAYLMVRL